MKQFFSSLVLTFVLAFAVEAVAFNLWPRQPKIYRVVGYLDEAPKDGVIRDRITIQAPGQPDRELLVIDYRTPGETPLDFELSRNLGRRYRLMGPKTEVAKLLDIPKGVQFVAVFHAYTDGPPGLYIGDLEYPVEPSSGG